jgi:capsule biosynthesis phosphatase
MRICLDLDGVICHTRAAEQLYEDVKPIKGAINTIRKMKRRGHYIIIDTARHVKTCGWNEGQIIARQAKTIINWLDRHGIPYDELWFSKPLADMYIDDKGHKFRNWEKVEDMLC